MNHWLLVGGRTFEKHTSEEGPYKQTAFLIDPCGHIIDRYSKRHLIPIGEYVPFEKSYPQLHYWAQLTEYIAVGDSDKPVSYRAQDPEKSAKIGVLICYEDLIPSAARKTVSHGADLLVCLINASAFEHPAALVQHRRLAQLRSVENRRYFVRCAGTGQSCSITPTGQIQQDLPLLEEGSMVTKVYLLRSQTLYTRLGYFFPYLFLACTLGILFRFRLARRRNEETTSAR